MKISIQDIYNKEVSCFPNSKYSSIPKFDMTIYGWIKSLGKQANIEAVNKVRTLTYDSNEYKEAKSTLLHAVTISATFNNRRIKHDVKKENNLIVIDIDAKDNPNYNVDEMKLKTANFPFVAITMKSASGKGIFNIIPYQEGLKYDEVYYSLEDYYKEQGIKTDDNNKDITRLRINTYDDKILIRKEIDVWTASKHKTRDSKEFVNKETTIDRETLLLLGSCIMELVEYYDYASSTYNQWLLDGFRLATIPHDIGLALFKYISQHSENYVSDEDVENKFNECCNTTTYNSSIIGYYFNLLKDKIGENWKEHLYIVYNINERLENTI